MNGWANFIPKYEVVMSMATFIGTSRIRLTKPGQVGSSASRHPIYSAPRC